MTRRLRCAAAVLLAAAAAVAPARALPSGVSYLHRLSTFSGTVPYSDARLRVDRAHGEIYAIAGNLVRVFNGAGMETYRFEEDPVAGQIVDLAALENGDLRLLVFPQVLAPDGPGWHLLRADYRGVVEGRLAPSGLPPEAGTGFRPDMLFYEGGRLLLLDRAAFRMIALDPSGVFLKGWDIFALAGMREKDRGVSDMGGAALDGHGHLLFTVPTLARVFEVSFDGAPPRVFGRSGSAPGSFGVVAGIAADDRGNIFVADKARGVVMIFDEHLEFVAEFGNEDGAAGLVRPTDLAWDDGKLHVTQARDRGVSVYRVSAPPTPSSDGPVPEIPKR